MLLLLLLLPQPRCSILPACAEGLRHWLKDSADLLPCKGVNDWIVEWVTVGL